MPAGLSVGVAAVPGTKRSHFCDMIQFQKELKFLEEAKNPVDNTVWIRTKPRRRSVSAFRIRRTYLPSVPVPAAPHLAVEVVGGSDATGGGADVPG